MISNLKTKGLVAIAIVMVLAVTSFMCIFFSLRNDKKEPAEVNDGNCSIESFNDVDNNFGIGLQTSVPLNDRNLNDYVKVVDQNGTRVNIGLDSQKRLCAPQSGYDDGYTYTYTYWTIR